MTSHNHHAAQAETNLGEQDLCETPLVLAVIATASRHGVSGRGFVLRQRHGMCSAIPEIHDLVPRITDTITTHCPSLLTHRGIGPDNAAALLITAGDNHDRLRNEASFAALCGVSPLEASPAEPPVDGWCSS